MASKDKFELTRKQYEEYQMLLNAAGWKSDTAQPDDKSPSTKKPSRKKKPPSIPPELTASGNRKKSENRQRTTVVSFRVTPLEYTLFQQSASNAGMKKGAFARFRIFGIAGERSQTQPTLKQKTLAMILAQLGKLGSNVNQLAKRANQDGFQAIAENELKEALGSISAMRAMVKIALKSDGH